MRMFRPFSWISESREYDKVVDGKKDHIMAHATHPVVEIMSVTAAKRKREGSMEISHPAQDVKRSKTVSLEKSEPPEIKLEHETSIQTEHGDVASTPVEPSRVCQAIESQFSLEILLKHNELRLINQELAKCQIALEQLRRCHLIPYPTSQGTHGSLLNIVNGTGPALDHGADVPKWAPSYGITEGPYSRHYARWLIPDPSFDGVQVERIEVPRAGKTIPAGRSTRHSIAEGVPATKRSHRGIATKSLKALSSGYSQVKEKPGPCILKRGDGQTVKLVCGVCNRYDFSSTQGFINHCRIAHKIDYKSHEEAAVACGQPIEFDEGGAVVGEEKSSPVANGLVHPMVRNAPMTKDALAAVMSRINASMELHKNGDPRVPTIPTSRPSITQAAKPVKPAGPNFVAASSTPFLSEMMRNMGFNKDLSEIVGDARNRVDLDDEYDSDGSDALPTTTQQNSFISDGTSSSPQPPMRVPARAGMSPAPFGRPVSSKGMGTSPRPSHATPLINTAAANLNRPMSRLITTPTMLHDAMHLDQMPEVDIEMQDSPSIIDLSPNTVTSNKPPSLVSDDGDYDDGTDADRESEGEEDDDSDVAEIDIEDDAVLVRNRGSEAMRIRKDEKHVSFVSPVKKQERLARRT